MNLLPVVVWCQQALAPTLSEHDTELYPAFAWVVIALLGVIGSLVGAFMVDLRRSITEIKLNQSLYQEQTLKATEALGEKLTLSMDELKREVACLSTRVSVLEDWREMHMKKMNGGG